jgi:hypothetical protein
MLGACYDRTVRRSKARVCGLPLIGVLVLSGCAYSHELRTTPFDTLLAAQCEHLRRCAHSGTQYASSMASPDLRECDPTRWDEERARLAAGSAYLDPEMAGACIAGLRDLPTCVVNTDDHYPISVSRPSVRPLEPIALACRRAYVDLQSECASTCGAGREHDPCESRAECGAPFGCEAGRCEYPCDPTACNVRGEGSWCDAGGACSQPRADGEECASSSECDFDRSWCERTWRHPDVALCTDQAPRVPLGEECAETSECGNFAQCGMGHVCREWEYCNSLAMPWCLQGRYCIPVEPGSDQGVCGASPEGAACVRGWHPWDQVVWIDTCPGGFLCGVEGTCHVRVLAGEACDASRLCDFGLGCSAGRCVELGWNGASCVDDGGCGLGFACSAGFCED